MTKRYMKCEGFTLIELSIVLVIIGLIAGGIVAGRELIEVAQVRKTVSQIEQFQTAVVTFRGKYNCLPGDCRKASTFLPSAIDGNGNGKINAVDTVVPDNVNIYHHLSTARLIAGTYQPFANNGDYDTANLTPDFYLSLSSTLAPKLANGYYLNVDTSGLFRGSTTINTGRHYLIILQSTYQFLDESSLFATFVQSSFIGIIGSTEVGGGIFPSAAYQIDAKIDDSNANSGKIMQYIDGICDSADGSASITPTSGIYNLNLSINTCIPMIKAAF